MTESGRKPARRPRREVFGLASQAEMYLHRAVDDFHRSGSPAALWVDEVSSFEAGSIFEPMQWTLTARNRRLQFLRSTVLHAAIASEAFSNEMVDELLDERDGRAIDRLPPVDKLLVCIQMAGRDAGLDRGAWPVSGLIALAKKRNALVHPRPQGGYAAWVQDLEEAEEKAFGPTAARDAILAIADAMVTCNALRKHPVSHEGLAKRYSENRAVFEQHLSFSGPKIMDVPARDGAEPPSIYLAAEKHAVARHEARKREESD